MPGQLSFIDKRVLITGGSRGIGRAAVELFLELGARVCVNGRTDASVEETLADLGNTENAFGATGDISTADGCERVIADAIGQLGGLDVLVNSAGVARVISIEDSDEQLWDATLDTNLKGTFFCSRAALPTLKASGGNIVNVASDAGLIGEAGLTVYCASKGGVVNMTRAMALEVAPDVRVNCVCPGYVDTDMVRRDYIEKTDEPTATEQALVDTAPLRRMATPGEIAHAIAYLASDNARNITGSALQIDGGTTAGHPAGN